MPSGRAALVGCHRGYAGKPSMCSMSWTSLCWTPFLSSGGSIRRCEETEHPAPMCAGKVRSRLPFRFHEPHRPRSGKAPHIPYRDPKRGKALCWGKDRGIDFAYTETRRLLHERSRGEESAARRHPGSGKRLNALVRSGRPINAGGETTRLTIKSEEEGRLTPGCLAAHRNDRVQWSAGA